MSQHKPMDQLEADLKAAVKAEGIARAHYDALENSTRPDRAALMAASSALGDAVLAEDQARAALNAAIQSSEA